MSNNSATFCMCCEGKPLIIYLCIYLFLWKEANRPMHTMFARK